MEFQSTTRRRRLEIIGLELIAASNRSGLSRNGSILEIYLALFSDAPWSISGLAQASQMDRAIVRDVMRRGVESGDIKQRNTQYAMSADGHRKFFRNVCRWIACIRPDIRLFLYQFFKDTGGTRPLRTYLMFVLSLDRAARVVKMESSYIAAYVMIEWEADPGGVTIRQAAERTGFSYSVMHKQISKLVNDGYLKRVDGKYVMTRKGRRYSFLQFVWSWRAVTMKEWRIASKMMTYHPNSSTIPHLAT